MWAAVVAAWVICWRRCIRLAQAGCSCFGALEALSAPSPAAACRLRAGLGDVAQARRRTLGPAARSGGTGLVCRLGAAGRRRGGACAAAGQLGGGRGHACARHDRTAHAGRGGTNGNARADRADGSASHRARAKLRRTGHKAGGDPGAEDAQRQQRERGQHHDQRMVDGRLVGMHLELREQARADADDDGQHQHLDARRHHVAEHLFREERGFIPERKRDQDEAGQRGQLELDQRDEKLYREHEEAEDHHQPSDEQHHDRIKVGEHLGKARHVADLLKNRRPSVDARLRQPARLEKVLHAQRRAGGRQAQASERPEHDARQPVEVVDDVGEGTDVEHLAQQLGDHVLPLAGGVAHRPVEAGDGHVDDDERGRQERHFALQQPETRVDVAREGIEESVDDGHVVHGVSSAAASGASPSGVSSVGVSKLAGIGGSSASVRYSSGPVRPAKNRRRKASAAARQVSSPAACRSAAHWTRNALSRTGSAAKVAARSSVGCWPQAVSSTASRTGTHRMAAPCQLL